MQNTPLTETHISLGAKMAPFAGYNMPIQYSGIREEHECVRTNVGVFDVSHMGEFIIRGKEALGWVQAVTSNDASKLEIGQAQYSCMPNKDGGIVDDLLVYRLTEEMCSEGEQAFMLVVNASNIEKDWNWIMGAGTFDARMINISEQTGLLAVQGPKAVEVLQTLTDVDLSAIPYYHFQKGKFAGLENVLLSATGYTGAGGFEIYAENSGIVEIWNAIFEAGKSKGILPIGLGARDTLRLEMGYCLYGNDIDDQTSPLEAGLGWITKLGKGEFTGSEWLNAQKANGTERKLVGIQVSERRVPRHGMEIVELDSDGTPRKIGYITSGTHSPSLDKPIAMGYVPKGLAKIGTEVFIMAGSKALAATVTKIPFLEGGV
jgi:aminomethyltransferase